MNEKMSERVVRMISYNFKNEPVFFRFKDVPILDIEVYAEVRGVKVKETFDRNTPAEVIATVLIEKLEWKLTDKSKKEDIVYVITVGSYDEYMIIGATTSKERASQIKRNAKRMGEDARIEKYINGKSLASTLLDF